MGSANKSMCIMFAASCGFLVSCGSSDQQAAGNQPAATNVLDSTAPPDRASPEASKVIYRVLTGLRDYPSDQIYQNGRPMPMPEVKRQALAIACEEVLGFEKTLPKEPVRLAREIEIPVEHNLYNVTLNVLESKQEVVPGKKINGVIFSDKIATRWYRSDKYFEGPIFVRGTCVGSEYVF